MKQQFDGTEAGAGMPSRYEPSEEMLKRALEPELGCPGEVAAQLAASATADEPAEVDYMALLLQVLEGIVLFTHLLSDEDDILPPRHEETVRHLIRQLEALLT